MFWLYWQQQGFGDRALSILHFAPEDCLRQRLGQENHREYATADLYEPGVTLNLDITDIALPEDRFDLIICLHVLEHIQEDRQAMRELRRVVRPGGAVLLQVPQDRGQARTYEDPSIVTPEARLEAFGQFDHVRVYGRDFGSRLRDAGFEVSVVTLARQLPAEDRKRYGLWDDLIFVCTK